MWEESDFSIRGSPQSNSDTIVDREASELWSLNCNLDLLIESLIPI